MSYESVCGKKDKRLLVLLTLGALILLLDHNVVSSQRVENNISKPSWIESKVSSHSLIRLNRERPREVHADALSRNQIQLDDIEIKSIMASLDDHQAVFSVTAIGEGRVQISVPTPRLSIFLGLPVAINQAGYEELLLFPGIGPFVAGNIIRYREKHGEFSKAEELKSVPGVGPKLVSRISSSLIFY